MKYVLLTGASSGLGIVLAKTLLEKKYFVILHYNQNNPTRTISKHFICNTS